MSDPAATYAGGNDGGKGDQETGGVRWEREKGEKCSAGHCTPPAMNGPTDVLLAPPHGGGGAG